MRIRPSKNLAQQNCARPSQRRLFSLAKSTDAGRRSDLASQERPIRTDPLHGKRNAELPLHELARSLNWPAASTQQLVAA